MWKSIVSYLPGGSSSGPRYSYNPLFISANDLINQSLDLMVIFTVCAEQQKDMTWLRGQLIDFFKTPLDGATASLPLSEILNGKSYFKYFSLATQILNSSLTRENIKSNLPLANQFAQAREGNTNTTSALYKFMLTDHTLTNTEQDLALLAIFNTIESIQYDEYHGKGYWTSPHKTLSFAAGLQYSSNRAQFSLKIEFSIKHLEKLRDEGQYIDVFNYASDKRIIVSTNEEYQRYKVEGDTFRQSFKEQLEKCEAEASLAPTNL